MTTRFYGLTGGIGSGKSTVAKIFSGLGVPILDLDQVGKDIIKQQPQLLEQLVQAFGNIIVHTDGSLNRTALAQIAFKDSASTNTLNTILHPAIQAQETIWREKQRVPIAIIEASVLIESGGYKRMDGIITVITDLDIRRQRVLKRGAQDCATFETIIQRQCSDQERLQYADYIIYNNHGIDNLNHETHYIFNQL